MDDLVQASLSPMAQAPYPSATELFDPLGDSGAMASGVPSHDPVPVPPVGLPTARDGSSTSASAGRHGTGAPGGSAGVSAVVASGGLGAGPSPAATWSTVVQAASPPAAPLGSAVASVNSSQSGVDLPSASLSVDFSLPSDIARALENVDPANGRQAGDSSGSGSLAGLCSTGVVMPPPAPVSTLQPCVLCAAATATPLPFPTLRLLSEAKALYDTCVAEFDVVCTLRCGGGGVGGGVSEVAPHVACRDAFSRKFYIRKSQLAAELHCCWDAASVAHLFSHSANTVCDTCCGSLLALLSAIVRCANRTTLVAPPALPVPHVAGLGNGWLVRCPSAAAHMCSCVAGCVPAPVCVLVCVGVWCSFQQRMAAQRVMMAYIQEVVLPSCAPEVQLTLRRVLHDEPFKIRAPQDLVAAAARLGESVLLLLDASLAKQGLGSAAAAARTDYTTFVRTYCVAAGGDDGGDEPSMSISALSGTGMEMFLPPRKVPRTGGDTFQ